APAVALRRRRRMTSLRTYARPERQADDINSEWGVDLTRQEVKRTDAYTDKHQAERVLGIGQKAELDAVALGDPDDGKIGGGADQRAVAAETGAQRQGPPQRGQLLGAAKMRRQFTNQRDHRRDERDVVDDGR